jgi:hypothetical protein
VYAHHPGHGAALDACIHHALPHCIAPTHTQCYALWWRWRAARTAIPPRRAIKEGGTLLGWAVAALLFNGMFLL